MCCFSRPVKSVSNTQIFGRLSGHGTQFVAYEMHFESESKNAMILPIPTVGDANEESAKFIDLKQYEWFFSDLHRSFPPLQPPPMMSRTVNSSAAMDSPLKVQQVGNFVASVVPKVQDFIRLDPLFSIAPETWAKIPVYNDYSFVVFQLESLAGRVHPMAFEFDTRHVDRVFFPTVHIHDGEVHSQEDFDHVLFCQHAGLDAKSGNYTSKVDMRTGWTRSKDSAAKTISMAKGKGIVDENLLVHRKFMKGHLANQDVFESASRDSRTSQSVWPRRLIELSPMMGLGLGLGALSLAWIVERRNRQNS